MIRLQITIVEDRPPEASIRAWRRIRTAAMLAMGMLWHRKFLPLHFRADARHRYHHKRRSKKYLDRKAALTRRGTIRVSDGQSVRTGKIEEQGQVDNVFLGDLRRAMLGPATIRAFPSRATVKMQGPTYITMRPYKSNQPDKAAELTYVRTNEANELAEVADREITRGLKQLKQPKVTRA